MKMTKTYADATIVFLDVDGVLNRNSTRPGDGVREVILQRPHSTSVFTGVVVPALVEAMVKTVVECRAKIVVSSSWREAFTSAAQFAAAIGIPPLADCPDLFHKDWETPRKLTSWRMHEINWWLDDHKEVKRYAILDDHDVCRGASRLASHFVQTDPNVGITAADLDRVAAILSHHRTIVVLDKNRRSYD